MRASTPASADAVLLVQLTDKGRKLHKQAEEVPQLILKASGRTHEGLQKLQADLLELRESLQKTL